MTTTARFVKFVEHVHWEGETWVSWLQVDGNEDQLDKLWGLLVDAEEADDSEEDFPYGLSDRNEETLPEEHVDVLVEHAEHTKIVGRFECPDSLDEDCRLIYKGQISKLFTAEVPGA
jgi:hypothetical protein